MQTVPPLYEALPTPDEMNQWDDAAHALFDIPPVLLMENAAREALQLLRELVPLSPDCNVLIFAGRGNNGGDGAALARLLYDEGCNVLLCPTRPLAKLRSPAREHVNMARKIGVNILPCSDKDAPVLPLEWNCPRVVVDAVAGTGLRGDLRDPELAVVRLINKFRDRSFIFSLDIPSGLCGLTGNPRPESVKAHATITFEAGKPGLFMPGAAEHTGRLAARRVGIPLAVRNMVPPSWKLLAPKPGSFAAPSPLRHKGDAGKVLIVGGSEGMIGAPLLAAKGALRAGAGLAHVAFPGGLTPQGACAEMQLHPLGHETQFGPKHAEALKRLMDTLRPDALALGPGLGREPGIAALLESLLGAADRPRLVIDADALFFFHLKPTQRAGRKTTALSPALLSKNDIATPHPGELARMLPDSFFPGSEEYAGRPQSLSERVSQLQQNRPGALEAFTQASPAVLVLKGAGTLIGQRDAPTALSPFAVPALAVGGSGDVLSGVIAALAASGYSSFDAASLGVYMHARAGELLAAAAPLGHFAGDIADAVPTVWKELCHN